MVFEYVLKFTPARKVTCSGKGEIFSILPLLRASTCAWQFSLDLAYFALSTVPEETEGLVINLLLRHCTAVILFAL